MKDAETKKTTALAAAITSALITMTLAAGLPLLWQPPAAWVLAAIAAFGAMVPFALASVNWRARLAAASQADGALTRGSAPAFPRWSFAFPVVAALASLVLYRMHFPLVRVVNLTPARIQIAVDGRPYGPVEPTSAESVTAGSTLRLPAGRHDVTAKDPDGRLVEGVSIFVESGREHLYAPASGGVCFWVESTGYGRRRGPDAAAAELLPRTRTFWVLPRGIDYWFTAAPPAAGDDRSSGGVSLALRQGRCDDATGPAEK